MPLAHSGSNPAFLDPSGSYTHSALEPTLLFFNESRSSITRKSGGGPSVAISSRHGNIAWRTIKRCLGVSATHGLVRPKLRKRYRVQHNRLAHRNASLFRDPIRPEECTQVAITRRRAKSGSAESICACSKHPREFSGHSLLTSPHLLYYIAQGEGGSCAYASHIPTLHHVIYLTQPGSPLSIIRLFRNSHVACLGVR